MAINSQFPTVDPGTFRHQLTFLAQVIGSDASGASITYAAGSQPKIAWGSIKYIRGTDKLASGQDVTQEIITVTMWYQAWVNSAMRIQSPSGRIYMIQAIENVMEMNTYLVLTCLYAGQNVAAS